VQTVRRTRQTEKEYRKKGWRRYKNKEREILKLMTSERRTAGKGRKVKEKRKEE
jgi:hypothetical protein